MVANAYDQKTRNLAKLIYQATEAFEDELDRFYDYLVNQQTEEELEAGTSIEFNERGLNKFEAHELAQKNGFVDRDFKLRVVGSHDVQLANAVNNKELDPPRAVQHATFLSHVNKLLNENGEENEKEKENEKEEEEKDDDDDDYDTRGIITRSKLGKIRRRKVRSKAIIEEEEDDDDVVDGDTRLTILEDEYESVLESSDDELNGIHSVPPPTILGLYGSSQVNIYPSYEFTAQVWNVYQEVKKPDLVLDEFEKRMPISSWGLSINQNTVDYALYMYWSFKELPAWRRLEKDKYLRLYWHPEHRWVTVSITSHGSRKAGLAGVWAVMRYCPDHRSDESPCTMRAYGEELRYAYFIHS